MEAILHRALILSLIPLGVLHAQKLADESWIQYVGTSQLASTIATLDDSAVMTSARDELRIRVRTSGGGLLRIASGIPRENAIVLGTLDKIPPDWGLGANLAPDSYWLKTVESGGFRYTVITAPNDRGVLYGTFALLRKMSLGESVFALDEQQSPAVPVRWVNQWDNLDGSIEAASSLR
jgi:alpha-glucuronidase